MPYLPEDRRLRLRTGAKLGKPGDLEYLITVQLVEYLRGQGLSHQTIAEIRGVLSGALSEFNRRVAFPYEDKKIRENGDAYPGWALS